VSKDLHPHHIPVQADHIAVEVNQDLTLRVLYLPVLPVHQGLQADRPAVEVAVVADHLQAEDSKLTVK
jgi:hypothetical protein